MIIVIGAGISGLNVAENLKNDFTIFEKNNYPGGLCTQYKSGEFWFDFSGHYLHFQGKKNIKDYVEKFSEFSEFIRDSRIFMFEEFIPYPIQYHLSYFPEKTAKIIFDEIKSRPLNGEPENLEESLIGNFGKTLYDLFFNPFMSKYYGRQLKEIVPKMDKGSIPVPDIKNVRDGLSGKKFTDKGYNPVFYYPKGDLRSMISGMERGVKKYIRYNEKVTGIDLNAKTVTTETGKHGFSSVVNTMPLNKLIRIIDPKPEWVPNPSLLESVSTIVVNLILKERRKPFHWVYLPETDQKFYRAGYYPARNYNACYLEMSVSENTDFIRSETESSAVEVLKNLDMIESEGDILHMDIKLIPDSYIIFNRVWKSLVPKLLVKLRENGIYSIGRYGAWNYSSMSDDIGMAIETARRINERNE